MTTKKTRAEKILETLTEREALNSKSKELFEKEIELRKKELLHISRPPKIRKSSR